MVVRDGSGAIIARLKKYIGQNTNNVAEYFGLIAALDYAQTHGVRALRVESDSELMVKQMRGQYKVKSADLKPLFERAKKMSQGLESFRIEHVYREQNREADALVNQALTRPDAAAQTQPRSRRQEKIRCGWWLVAKMDGWSRSIVWTCRTAQKWKSCCGSRSSRIFGTNS